MLPLLLGPAIAILVLLGVAARCAPTGASGAGLAAGVLSAESLAEGSFVCALPSEQDSKACRNHGVRSS